MAKDLFHRYIFIEFQQLAAIAIVLKQRMIKVASEDGRQVINKSARRVGHQLIQRVYPQIHKKLIFRALSQVISSRFFPGIFHYLRE